MAVPFILRGATPSVRGLRQPELTAGSFVTLAHLFLLIAAYRAPGPTVAEQPAAERVTYVDVAPPTPESPRAAATKPKPIVVSSEVTIPAATPTVDRPDRLAGTQVLLIPKEASGVPQEAPADSAVRASDFSGRGVVGGVSGGRPPATAPPAVAESLASDVAAPPAVEAPLPPRHIEARLVRQPQLRNRDEVLRFMNQSYPAMLQQAGIEGTAIVEVMVDTTGSVVPSYTRVLQATHPLFADAAKLVAARARFDPGEGEFAGRTVSLSARVRLPMRWVQQH